MQESFSIEDVAFILQSSVRTILRRLGTDELKGVKRGKSWFISKAALRKWIFRAIKSPDCQRTYENKNHVGIIVEQNRGQTSALNRYAYREKPDFVIPGNLIKPRRAAIKLQGRFRRCARRLAENDRATQDDLVQEMCLAVLQCKEPANASFFMSRAKSRAYDYLDRENKRGTVRLEEKHLAREPQAVSSPEILRLLLDTEIPAAKLREMLGVTIDPDFELARIHREEWPTPQKGDKSCY